MRSSNRKLFGFIALLITVSLACGAVAPTAAPANPPPPTSLPPVVEVQPTREAPVEQPTQPEPPQVNQQFFTEEFDAPLSSAWSILTVRGSASADPDKVTVEPNNGKLVWNFDSEYLYYYLFYEGANYTDVKLEVMADNRGRNNNYVSLICRYDPDIGWYEFNIANNGLYSILYGEVTQNGDIGYNLITNGGSNAIKQGKDVNDYSITCAGNKLSLTINGKSVTEITERNYGLREGGIGISVGSENVLPIIVEMDWFKVSEP
jgi:hypothetical protein